MYKARRYFGSKSLVNLFHYIYIYIYPYLVFCIELWGNAAHCHLESLFKLRKTLLELLLFLTIMHTPSPYLIT